MEIKPKLLELELKLTKNPKIKPEKLKLNLIRYLFLARNPSIYTALSRFLLFSWSFNLTTVDSGDEAWVLCWLCRMVEMDEGVR